MKTEYTVAYLFGGIGGGALGFQGARAEHLGQVATFRSLCSIDADPVVCRNYELITGQKAVCMDLFDRQQYRDFHKVAEPPADWHESEPWDIWQAFGEEVPDVIFTSPPCKGFSGLLPEKSAKSSKYQALNLLTIRGIDITLAACRDYGGELPSLFLLENVPRIMSRGKKILDKIKQTLIKYGYGVNDESHDCGEIGGLGQHRKRYLLIARNEKKMGSFVYRPEIKPLKTIGDILNPLPSPGDTVNGGPLNAVPKLQRKTWERLAFIPAGGDWRDLAKVEFEKYGLQHEIYGVSDVADPKVKFKPGTHRSIYRVVKDEETAPTVTGGMRPNNGALSVADSRLTDREGRHPGVYRIVRVDQPAPCVTGTRFGSGAIAIADPSLGCSPRSGSYGVQRWSDTATTVTGSGDVHSGCTAVADPRIPRMNESCVMIIIAEDGTWHRPTTTFELAMLQSFDQYLPDGRPFQLEGCSDAKAREYVGNAVPKYAAMAIANVMLMALVLSSVGITFMFTHQEVWVRPEEEVLDQQLVH